MIEALYDPWVGRQVRVNYYVRELYGDPDAFHDAWAAPFGVLAMKAPTTLFVHPVVEKVQIGIALCGVMGDPSPT